MRWRSIQTWEKEQEWERDSHEIRIAVCATNADKSIEGCCSVAALWRPMKLDRISSKTNLRLYNKEIFTLISIRLQKWGKIKGGITRRVITKKWPSLDSWSVSPVKFNGAVDLLHNSPHSLVVPLYHKNASHAPSTPTLLSVVSLHIDLRRDPVGVVMMCSRKRIAARRK